jgi:cytochrome bd ubiquinol oxidase subunit II
VITCGWLTWLHVGISSGFVPEPIEALALVAVFGGAWLAESQSEGWAFAASATAMGSVVASIFFELFPRVMVSSTKSAYNLTVSNSASNSYSLKVMTVVAVIFLPLILLYQGWSLYIFRKRIGGGPASKVAAPVEPEVPPTAGTQPSLVGGAVRSAEGQDPGQGG